MKLDAKAAEDSRTPGRWRARVCARVCRKVLECGSPLPLFVRHSASYVLAVLNCLGGIFCAIDCRATEEPTQREYELKAAVLYHIIEYVEWPSEALSSQPTLQLGLVRDIPFSAAIELLDGKTVHALAPACFNQTEADARGHADDAHRFARRRCPIRHQRRARFPPPHRDRPGNPGAHRGP